MGRRRLGGHGRGPQGQKRGPHQGRTGHCHAVNPRAHDGERTVMGPGETPRAFSQKEVEAMRGTTSENLSMNDSRPIDVLFVVSPTNAQASYMPFYYL